MLTNQPGLSISPASRRPRRVSEALRDKEGTKSYAKWQAHSYDPRMPGEGGWDPQGVLCILLFTGNLRQSLRMISLRGSVFKCVSNPARTVVEAKSEKGCCKANCTRNQQTTAWCLLYRQSSTMPPWNHLLWNLSLQAFKMWLLHQTGWRWTSWQPIIWSHGTGVSQGTKTLWDYR